MRVNGRPTAHQHPSPAGPEGARGTGAVSGLLRAWGKGDLEAREQLMPLVYGELRRRAAAYLNRERKDHTLQPTALVHEAYLRLIGQERVGWQNRAHFYGVAAQTMRRILVDHARGHQRDKRFGAAVRVALDDMIGAEQPRDCEMLLLDQALNELAALDPRQAQIVELRYSDLKPANIKLRPDGTVKILAFGLARMLGAADVNSNASARRESRERHSPRHGWCSGPPRT